MRDAACAWIEANLARFVVAGADVTARMASIKAIGDLAHAADVLERAGDPRGTAWLTAATAALAGGERIRELIAASPMYAPAAVTFLPFELAGRGNPALIATLAAQVTRAELPPLAWTMLVPTLELYGIAPTAAMRAAAARTSVLANRTPAARLPEDAVYVLAHECMYATRWGRTRPAWDDATSAYAARALPELIDRAIAARDADLLAELVLATHAALDICVAPAAWDMLAAAQAPAGNVEPPATLITMFPRLPHPTLGRTYHTTLVAIMAWSACRHRRGGPL